jgi:hypothetical protein
MECRSVHSGVLRLAGIELDKEGFFHFRARGWTSILSEWAAFTLKTSPCLCSFLACARLLAHARVSNPVVAQGVCVL